MYRSLEQWNTRPDLTRQLADANEMLKASESNGSLWLRERDRAIRERDSVKAQLANKDAELVQAADDISYWVRVCEKLTRERDLLFEKLTYILDNSTVRSLYDEKTLNECDALTARIRGEKK